MSCNTEKPASTGRNASRSLRSCVALCCGTGHTQSPTIRSWHRRYRLTPRSAGPTVMAMGCSVVSCIEAYAGTCGKQCNHNLLWRKPRVYYQGWIACRSQSPPREVQGLYPGRIGILVAVLMPHRRGCPCAEREPLRSASAVSLGAHRPAG